MPYITNKQLKRMIFQILSKHSSAYFFLLFIYEKDILVYIGILFIGIEKMIPHLSLQSKIFSKKTKYILMKLYKKFWKKPGLILPVKTSNQKLSFSK